MTVNRLNALRKERGLTLKELSAELSKIGIKATHSQLGYWEKGERSPRSENTWKQLADFFDVSESYLLGYVDYKEDIPIGGLVSAIFQEFSSTGYSTLLAMKYLSRKRQKEVRDFARFMVIQESKEDKNWQDDGYLLDRAHKFSKILLEDLPPRP